MKAFYQAPINEQFNDSYGQSGLQPSTGGISPVRNVNVEYKNDPTVRRGGRTVAGGNIQASTVVERGVPQKESELSQYSGRQSPDELNGSVLQNTQSREPGRGLAYSQKLKRRRKYIPGKAQQLIVTASSVKNTAKGARTTYAIWSWAFYVWFWFQVPVAVFSLVFMGMQQALYSLWTAEVAFRQESSAIVNAARTVAGVILSAFKWVVEQFLDFFDIDPNIIGGLFLMTHLIVMIIGWLTLFTAVFIYKASGNNPVFGNGAGGKSMTFLLALIAYAIPFINIFPWFAIWTLMVLKNPK